MTAEQVLLTQASWGHLELLADAVGTRFYSMLFERLPEVQPLFSGDADNRGVTLMSMLGLAVHTLDRLADLGPTVQVLAQHHLQHNVKPEYYLPFRESLLEAMRQVLGRGFTPQVQEAWVAMLDTLAGEMGMYAPAQQREPAAA
jgi:hemoglobin-like flavoprotein